MGFRKVVSNQSPNISPYQNVMYKIPLAKISISNRKKEDLLSDLSKLQKTLNLQQTKATSFLQKNEVTVPTLYELKLENYRSEQVRILSS